MRVCGRALTQQRGGSRGRGLERPGCGEALGRVAAAVVQAQLLPRGLGGRRLLGHLLLTPALLAPELVAVLPEGEAAEGEGGDH